MNTQGQWQMALTGLAFVLLGVFSFVIVGDPPTPGDDSAREIVRFYEDNGTVVGIGSVGRVPGRGAVRGLRRLPALGDPGGTARP